MFCMLKKKKYILLVFKNTFQMVTQVIFLMISNGEQQWDYLAVKKLSALLRGTTSKRHGHFYCLNSLHSFPTETKLEFHKKVCEIKIFVTL